MFDRNPHPSLSSNNPATSNRPISKLVALRWLCYDWYPEESDDGGDEQEDANHDEHHPPFNLYRPDIQNYGLVAAVKE